MYMSLILKQKGFFHVQLEVGNNVNVNVNLNGHPVIDCEELIRFDDLFGVELRQIVVGPVVGKESLPSSVRPLLLP